MIKIVVRIYHSLLFQSDFDHSRSIIKETFLTLINKYQDLSKILLIILI